MCPKCKSQISWWDNIPLLSYLFLAGKCRKCKRKISLIYPVLEFLTGLFFVWWFLIGFGFFKLVGSPWMIVQPIFWLGIGLILISIFMVDLLYMVIPFGLNVFLFVWVLTYKFALVTFGHMRLIDFFIGLSLGLVLSLFFSSVNVLTRKIRGVDGFGLGDIYMAPSLGLILGWPKFLIGIFLSFVIGAVVGIILIVNGGKSKEDYLPFAPFLILGSLIALLYGDKLWQFYISFLI